MFSHKIVPFYQTLEKYVRKNFALSLSLIVLIVAVGMTFRLQNRIVGWEPGYDELQPKHHGWVSSQGLAIIASATLENKFVGYAIEYKDEQNVIHSDYFDRYPVFFSAIFNRVLSITSKLSSKIYLAKQVMNLIFLGTLILAFLIIDKLIRNKPLALAVVFLAFSNPFLLFFKDMVHFDQPALFGFMLLIYAIALFKLDGLKLPVILATFVAIALGRGYASYAVLIVWLAMEGLLVLKSKGLTFGQKIKTILKHPSFYLLVIGIVWGAGLLSYNIFVEAGKRNISPLETSILHSAGQRLSLNEDFNQEYANIIDWGDFLKGQVNRIIKWSFPVNKVDLGFIGNSLLLILMFFIMGVVVRRQTLERRMIYLLLMLSGFVWLIPMRNLSAFHDYTTMYYIGIPLVFFAAVFQLLRTSKDATYYLAVMGLIIYLSAITSVKELHESIADDASKYTYDFNQIVDQIDGKGNNVYMAEGIPFGQYAPRFYLSDQYLAPLDIADYVITPDETYSPDNLTPDNTTLFLFKKVK